MLQSNGSCVSYLPSLLHGNGSQTEHGKAKGLRNAQKNAQRWSALEGAACMMQSVPEVCDSAESIHPQQCFFPPFFLSQLAALTTSFQHPGACWPGGSQHKAFYFFFPLMLFSGGGISAVLGSTK